MYTTITVKNNSTNNIPWLLTFDNSRFELVSRTLGIPKDNEMFMMLDYIEYIDRAAGLINAVICSGFATVDPNRSGMPSTNLHIGRKRFVFRRKV